MLLLLLDWEAAEHKVADMLVSKAGIGREKNRDQTAEEALGVGNWNIEAHCARIEQKRLQVESIENRA